MTDDDRLPTCSQHRWSGLRPVWSEDATTQDPTRLVEVCIRCDWQRDLPVKVGGHK
jgi:hypothetical protein